PPHRVEDRLAVHALVAGDDVGVGVGEDVSDVQAAAHGGWGSVDGVDVLPRLGAVEGVGALVLPTLGPLLLESLQRRLLRYDDLARGRRRRLGGGGRVGVLAHVPNVTCGTAPV